MQSLQPILTGAIILGFVTWIHGWVAPYATPGLRQPTLILVERFLRWLQIALFLVVTIGIIRWTARARPTVANATDVFDRWIGVDANETNRYPVR